MKVDALLSDGTLATLAARAGEAEALGFDGFFTSETKNDPFLPLALATERTRRLDLGTCIAVATPRSPMHLAQIGHELQRSSHGRFILGLGSQVRTHVERRYGARWSDPVPRMREMVHALRAIWGCWNDGEELDFQGEFYRHTLMPPFFDPGPTGYSPPPVFLAGVGEAMVEVAGEVADGLFVHRFTTRRYLREVILPALDRGLDRAQRPRSAIEVGVPLFVVSGTSDQAIERSEAEVRAQISFYASTPAYRPVLDLHGWGDLQSDLNLLAKANAWGEMTALIPDEVLDAFTVRAAPGALRAEITRIFGGDVDRVMLSMSAKAALNAQAEASAILDARGHPAPRADDVELRSAVV